MRDKTSLACSLTLLLFLSESSLEASKKRRHLYPVMQVMQAPKIIAVSAVGPGMEDHDGGVSTYLGIILRRIPSASYETLGSTTTDNQAFPHSYLHSYLHSFCLAAM